jgi:hypothetical protein
LAGPGKGVRVIQCAIQHEEGVEHVLLGRRQPCYRTEDVLREKVNAGGRIRVSRFDFVGCFQLLALARSPVGKATPQVR